VYGIYETIQELLDRGGNVMVLLAWVVFVMWTLIVERLLFMLTENRIGLKAVLSERESRQNRQSWCARAIYQAAVSRLSMRFEAGIQMIRTLARLCPLFGLMGTVAGMIAIFEVMATIGSSSPRAMAAGVAKATLTTMAGMVGALSGIFPAAILSRLAHDQQHSLQMHCLTSSGIVLSPISGLPKKLRLIVAPIVAFIITMGLLFLMQTLIETGEVAIQKVTVSEYADYIRVRRDEVIDTRSIKPKKFMPEEMPERIEPDLASDQETGAISIEYSMSRPALTTISPATLAGDFGSPDSEVIPLVRVPPMYPRRALKRGIEGWVMLEFTITATGSVKDVRVYESSHSVFESSAVRALEKFKFRPRFANGEPVAVTGVRYKLNFEIED